LPIYIFIYKGNTGAEYIWVFISIYAALNFLIFFFRYKSNKWVKKMI
jgi:Na+-driven multidrug efflux pump